MNEKEIFREKLKTSEFRDITSEKILIAGILKYKDILRKCSKELRADIFSSDRCKIIYEAILNFYNYDNAVLETDAFQVKLESRPQSERNALFKLWKNIVKKKKTVRKSLVLAIIPKLQHFHQARLVEFGMHKSIIKLKKAVNEGHNYIEEAKKEYLSVVDSLHDKVVNCNVTDPLSLYQDFKLRHIQIQKDPSLLKVIPTGIAELDKTMLGLRPSELGLITAGTGVGKSIMLGDFGFSCYIAVGDVLYVTIEMSEDQLRERFYCRLSGIEYDNFRRYKLDEHHWKTLDRKIEKLLKDHEHKYHIMDAPQSCSVKILQKEIEQHIRKHGEPKLIIIDYMNILQGGFDWSKQIEICVEIKQLIARYFKIATWTANQLQGSKHDKETVKIGDMAFAKNIIDNIDVGIGIGMTDATEENDVFNINFTKTRNFKGKSFLIEADRSRMTFTKSKPKTEDGKFKKKENIGGKLIV